MKKALRVAVTLLAILGALTNVAGLINGFSLLRSFIRIHVYDLEYFDYAYFSNALLWLAISLTGIMFAVVTMVRRSYKGILPTLSLALGLMSMVALPDVGPRVNQMRAVFSATQITAWPTGMNYTASSL